MTFDYFIELSQEKINKESKRNEMKKETRNRSETAGLSVQNVFIYSSHTYKINNE